MTRRRIAILGSTGSIGTQALDVVAQFPDRFEVTALAAGRRVEELLQQAKTFRPAIICTSDPANARVLEARVPAGVAVASGAEGLVRAAAQSGAQVVLAATDGMVSFEAVFAAIEAGIDVAVANKELIVAAGDLVLAAAARSGSRILPVDSEHSAIFQTLAGEPKERVAQIILTASGGPFWDWSAERIAAATVADALRHPTWQMGVKNTVDSASMLNKGLEVIEACRLFGLPPDHVEVLVHRSSIVHGFVVFTDGNVKAQLAAPDMRLPIGYALAYPDRLPSPPRSWAQTPDPLRALGARDGSRALELRFERPDLQRFPCLGLAYRALRAGGTAPAVLSAANEVAVQAFVDGKLRFGEIGPVIAEVLDQARAEGLSLESLRAADERARRDAETIILGRGTMERTANPSYATK